MLPGSNSDRRPDLVAPGSYVLGLRAPGSTLDIWPTQLLVSGTPAQGIAGTVDLLHIDYADFNQTLAWNKFGDELGPQLHPNGFALFDAPFK